MAIIVPIITAVIGTVFRARGPAAKARAAGAAGAVVLAAQPVVDAFIRGFETGAMPKIEELGVIVGSAVAGWLFTYGVTWLSPRNTN